MGGNQVENNATLWFNLQDCKISSQVEIPKLDPSVAITRFEIFCLLNHLYRFPFLIVSFHEFTSKLSSVSKRANQQIWICMKFGLPWFPMKYAVFICCRQNSCPSLEVVWSLLDLPCLNLTRSQLTCPVMIPIYQSWLELPQLMFDNLTWPTMTLTLPTGLVLT